eukprot:m.256115 g.256115  ORF g.256115 m.256115 type:complete len:676 (+) comp19948_c0_seq1:105-2132(+)
MMSSAPHEAAAKSDKFDGLLFRVIPAAACVSLRIPKPPAALGAFNPIEDVELARSATDSTSNTQSVVLDDVAELFATEADVFVLRVDPNDPNCTSIVKGLSVSSDAGHQEPPQNAPQDFNKKTSYKQVSVAELAAFLDVIQEAQSTRKPAASIPRDERVHYCINADRSSGAITSCSACIDLNQLFPQLSAFLSADERCPGFRSLDALRSGAMEIKRKDGLLHKFVPYICFGVHTSKLPKDFTCIPQPDELHRSHCFIIPTGTVGPYRIDLCPGITLTPGLPYGVVVPALVECGWAVHCIRLVGAAQPRPPGPSPDPLFKLAATLFDCLGAFSNSLPLCVTAVDLLAFLDGIRYTLKDNDDRAHVLATVSKLSNVVSHTALHSAVERLRIAWEPKCAVVAYADVEFLSQAPIGEQDPDAPEAARLPKSIEREFPAQLLSRDLELESLRVIAVAGSVLLKVIDVPESLASTVINLLTDPLAGQQFLHDVATEVQPVEIASRLRVLAAHEAQSNTNTLIPRLCSDPASLETASFVSVFMPSSTREFTFWHSVALVVRKYLSLVQAEVLGTRARFMFMDLDNVAKPISLLNVFGTENIAAAMAWAATLISTHEADLAQLGIEAGKDDLSLRGTGPQRVFMLFSWSERQHAMFTRLVQSLFHQSPNRGGFDLRCVHNFQV